MTGQSLTDVTTTAYRDTNHTDVSTALVVQFADETGADVHELPPLYDVIDPEALNRLLDDAPDDVRVSFDYCGHRIVVAGDGTVSVESRE